MERNPEKIKKFIPAILNDQPHKEEIVRRLFEATGFENLTDLIHTSQNIDGLMIEAYDILWNSPSEQDKEVDDLIGELNGGFLKMSVPYGVNPLDMLDIKTEEELVEGEGSEIPFNLEMGLLHSDGNIEIQQLDRRDGRATILRLENTSAINYLLSQYRDAA